MSEATRKLRSIEAHTTSVCGVRDLAADAIEAVEAQVAEAVARVEKLEEMGRLGASPNGDDRTRGDMSPRGFDSPTPAAPTPPAPSAVTAPRGFREGDICRVIESKRTKENFLVGCEGRINPYRGSGGDWVIDCGTAKGVRCFYNSELTLVRAAAAPEAPAEEDTGLVVQRIRDEATKPLHVEIEKLRGEVARLTAERDEARAISAATAERVRNETQIATELRKDLADANDRLTSQSRSIEEMHAELAEAHKWRDDLRAKLAAAEQALDVERRTLIVNASGGTVVAPTREACLLGRKDFHTELAAAKSERDALRAELDALRAKPRFRTRKVTEADVKEFWRDDGSALSTFEKMGFRRRVDGAK